MRLGALHILVAILGLALSACGTDECCKVCDEGRACGDACISSSSTCNAGPGCACNK